MSDLHFTRRWYGSLNGHTVITYKPGRVYRIGKDITEELARAAIKNGAASKSKPKPKPAPSANAGTTQSPRRLLAR